MKTGKWWGALPWMAKRLIIDKVDAWRWSLVLRWSKPINIEELQREYNKRYPAPEFRSHENFLLREEIAIAAQIARRSDK